MKWVHLSDLHFITNCTGGNKRLALDTLIAFLRELEIRTDELFLTGDFRFAKTQKEADNQQVAKDVADYIWEIASCLGIDDEQHIHIVPGNHDLNREQPLREDIVDGIYTRYHKALSTGNVDDAELNKDQINTLNSAFSFFNELLNALYSEKKANRILSSMREDIHYYDYDCNEFFNILCINTAVTSVKKSEHEEGTLLVSHKHVDAALCKLRAIDPAYHKPVIVLAHHPIDHLDNLEKEQLAGKYFFNRDVYLYISGHSHQTSCSIYNGIMYVTQGSLETKEGVQTSFGYGKYVPPSGKVKKGKILVKSYQFCNGCWGEDKHFGSRGNDRLSIKRRRENPYSKDLRVPISEIDKGHEVSKVEAERNIIKTLGEKEKDFAVKYLLTGLSDSDQWHPSITTQLFFDEFFVSPPESEDRKIRDILNELFVDDQHNFLCLRGGAGSGKTTFIKTIAMRGLDDISRSRYYRYHILDCSKTDGSTHSNNLFPCASIKKQIKDELYRMNRASKNNGALWETYLMTVLANITIIDRSYSGDFEEFFKYITYVREMFKEYGVLRYSSLAGEIAGEKLAINYDPVVQLSLLLIILTCKNCFFKPKERRKHIIVFDNIEEYTDHVAKPVPKVFYSANTYLTRLFDFLNDENAFVISALPTQTVRPNFMLDFAFIVCARYATKVRTVHSGQKIYGENDKYIVERDTHVFAVEALLRKMIFLKQKVANNKALNDEVEKIVCLLITKTYASNYLEGRVANRIEAEEARDLREYITDKHLPLFNNDFRKAVRALASLYNKVYATKSWMEHALSFRQDDFSGIGNVRKNASRMVLLKNTLDNYVNEGYLDLIGFPGNLDNGKKAFSTVRMIITCLYFDQEKSSTGTSLYKIIDYFRGIYDRADIIDSILKLSYHVAPKDENKNNLLSGWGYFVDVLDCEDADLEYILHRPEYDKITKIRLTPVGVCMASYVTLQFEFFSARIPHTNDIPLILFNDHHNGNEYDFEKTLNSVYFRIIDFSDGILAKKGLHSQCNHKSCLTYDCPTYIRISELLDVIMEHIFYIDRFRMIMWADYHSPILNTVILRVIKNYFEIIYKIDNSKNLIEKCKQALRDFKFSRHSQSLDKKGFKLDRDKLADFLKEESGDFWMLEDSQIYDSLKLCFFQ